MFQVPINFWAVLGSAVVSMIIGSLWYGPLFGKQWMNLSDLNEEKLKASKGMWMPVLYALALVGSLVMSFVLAHALVFTGAYFQIVGLSAGLMVGFLNWLGFIAPVTLGSVLWEGKPWKLWLLNNAYYLVTLLVMGMILASL